MRVGLILYGSLEMRSGGFLYDRVAVRYLREQADEVVVFSLPWGTYARGLVFNLSRSLPRRLTRARLDVVVQDELAHPSLFALNKRLKAGGDAPVVAIVHHPRCLEARPPWQNRLYRLIERAYLRSVDGFVFNSEATREAVESMTGQWKPSVVAYPGGDRFKSGMTEADVSARSAAEGPLKILFVGNVIPRKGLHSLAAALAPMSGGAWHLSVVGSTDADPAYVRAVKKGIERAGIGPYVTFHGAIADEELPRILAESHVLAVPSSYEGFGIVYPEAMRFGLPVIASAAGGAGEVVEHGVDGFLVTPGDATALAGHMKELAFDRKRLDSMAITALRNSSRHPTWAGTGGRIHEFLHGLGR